MQQFKVTSRIARGGRCLFLPVVGCSYLPLHKLSLSLLTIFLFSASLFNPVHASFQRPVELVTDSQISTAGFFHLQWSAHNYTGNWQLQESQDESLQTFKVIYAGPDLARVISGKSDGIYYYRVATNTAAEPRMSNIIKVTVAHHPLGNAFAFFTIGAFIFLAILVSIITGNRKNTKS